jgi:hypothetical protein
MTFTVTTEGGSKIEVPEGASVVVSINGVDYEISIMRK